MHLNNDIHIRPNSLAHGCKAVIAPAQYPVRQYARQILLVPVALPVHGENVHLKGIVSFFLSDKRGFRIGLGINKHGLVLAGTPAELQLAGISSYLAARFAAK